MRVATRKLFRHRFARLAQEFGVAVTLCAIAVVAAGGVSDSSMRIGLVMAAIYLMIAEVQRQMPELTRHAATPLRRLIREEGSRGATAPLSDSLDSHGDSLDSPELIRALAALTEATRDSHQTYAHVEKTIDQVTMELHRALDALMSTRIQSTQANVERTPERMIAEWLRITSEQNRAVIVVLDEIREKATVRENLLRDAVTKLDRIASKLESNPTTPMIPGTSSTPTPIVSTNYQFALQQIALMTLTMLAENADRPRPEGARHTYGLISGKSTVHEASRLGHKFVTVSGIGQDRPGIVYQIANAITKHRGSILLQRSMQVAGEYAIVVIASFDDHKTAVAAIQSDLAGGAIGENFAISVRDTKMSGLMPPTYRGTQYVVTMKGIDRIGIVESVALLLLQRNLNLDAMQSEVSYEGFTGAPVLKLKFEITVPAGFDMDSFAGAIEEFARNNELAMEMRREDMSSMSHDEGQ